MIEYFVKRPATTVMLSLFFVLLGIVSFFELNVEQSPRIDFPLVVINVTYPGASPLEVESQTLRKIEDSVVEISEIKKMESRAFDSFGYVLVEFLLSADVNSKAAEVKDKVESILNDLPAGVERPIVQRVDPFSTSVIDLILSSDHHSPTELYEYADKHLKSQLSRVSGVGEIELFGGAERQIRVQLIPDLMQQKFISIDRVINQLRARNITIPGGNIERTSSAVAVRFDGEFSTIEDISNLRLTTPDGSRFPLSAIARVYDGSKDASTVSRFNGEEVVSLSVKKVSDGNDVQVANGIRKLAADLKSALPKGMELNIAVDRSDQVVRETDSTLGSILIGVFLTVCVLYFFTGNFRLTLISSVVIPASIISAFFMMEKSGFTINFITLLAIATSLGTLIANAIVIIETVLEHLKSGKSPEDAAIDGTKEVTGPILAAGGTNLVVFTPIAFMGGIVGQFMLQFGMTVVYATLFSLLASFTLTPMMCAALLRPITETLKRKKGIILRFSEGLVRGLLNEYRRIFNLLFAFPKSSILVALGLLLLSFTLAPYLGNEFIPTYDRDRLEVKFSLPQGTRVNQTAITARRIEKLFDGKAEVVSVLGTFGRNGEENGSVVVNLTPSANRKKSDLDIIRDISPQLALIPDAEVEVARGESRGSNDSDISINVSGLEYETMISLSSQMRKIMQESGYFQSVVSSYKSPKSEATFIPDPAKMERYGVKSSHVGQVVRSSIYGDDTNIFRENGEEYDIVVEMGDEFKTSLDAMSRINIIADTGLIPITALGDVAMKQSIPPIQRRDRRRVIQLNANLAKSTAGVVQAELAESFKQINFPAGFEYNFVGKSESQAESSREIGKAFGLAIILTYMILAAILNSFLHPFTISSAILTSFGGVFVMLFFTESSINIASMLGFVMLVGLAVNNAILILEETEVALRDQPNAGAQEIKEAIWHGMQSKFRAVLMTSLAIVFGSLPQMWSPDLAKASMGAVIVGGVLASILFTFILVPQTYWYLERCRRWITRKKAAIQDEPQDQVRTVRV